MSVLLQVFPKRLIAIVAAAALSLALLAAVIAQDGRVGPNQSTNLGVIETFASNATGDYPLAIVTTSPDGALLANATYLIRPSPLDDSGSLAIADNGADDSDRAFGMIAIASANDGNYTIIQTSTPSGFARDRLPKTIQVAEGQQATATFTNSQAPPSRSVREITYTAMFNCGTISGGEGPLRPGHYDTDISILNNEQQPVKLRWNVVINEGRVTNVILQTLGPEHSMSIVCKDLSELFGIGSEQKFVSGFAIIRLQVQGALGSLAPADAAIVNQLASGSVNPLEVQVFYTANALTNLPAPVLVDKIIFSIQNDTSGKVPDSMLEKTLDVTLESGMNEISDPELKVKEAIAAQFGLSDQERNSLQIRIMDVSVGVGAMIDDHAISLTRVPPQASG